MNVSNVIIHDVVVVDVHFGFSFSDPETNNAQLNTTVLHYIADGKKLGQTDNVSLVEFSRI